jgi:outer membrane protein
MKKQSIATALVAAAALCGAGSAHAQAAGSMLVKAGWNRIVPHVESGDLSAPALPGSKINVESASSLVVTAAYMFTDNISVEFLGGLPYKHDITGAGAVGGAGKIGSVHQISPTVVLQYRFLEAQAPLRPYVGGGLTWARFYDTEGSAALTSFTNPGGSPTTIGSDTAWGGTIEGGLNYKIDSHWFLDAAMLKTWIKTDPTLSTGQKISAKLNPVSFQVSVGYTF